MTQQINPFAKNQTMDFITEYDFDLSALWCFYTHCERPCYTRRVLSEILDIQHQIKQCHSNKSICFIKPKYLIWASKTTGIFNLGGDLELFANLVRAGEKGQLQSYAYQCVKTVYNNFTNLDLPLLGISLVQGNALGGGFEAALSSDIIIAERRSKFGLPEIKFNLFPGMGAYSLLCRRLGSIQARKMILSGGLYSAEEMYHLGIVDVLTDDGEGNAAVYEFIQQNQSRHRALLSLSEIKRRCQPILYEELIDVTDLWVDTALTLEEADLRHMERLARAQRRHRQRVNTGGLA